MPPVRYLVEEWACSPAVTVFELENTACASLAIAADSEEHLAAFSDGTTFSDGSVWSDAGLDFLLGGDD